MNLEIIVSEKNYEFLFNANIFFFIKKNKINKNNL